MSGKRPRPTRRNSGQASGLVETLGLRTSAEIAAIWNAKTGDRMTDSDVRHVLKSAHEKLARALANMAN